MNDNVKISFIPQKPLARGEAVLSGRPKFGFSFILASVILFITLSVTIGQAYYIYTIDKKITAAKEELRAFNDELDRNDTIANIDSLRVFEQRINLARQLLSSHVATSRVFSFLEAYTPEAVGFQSYDFSSEAGEVTVNMRGRASSYEAIAYLSEVYRSKGDVLQNYSFSRMNLELDGKIMFNVSSVYNLDELLYSKGFEGAEEEVGPQVNGPSIDPNNNDDE